MLCGLKITNKNKISSIFSRHDAEREREKEFETRKLQSFLSATIYMHMHERLIETYIPFDLRSSAAEWIFE